MLPASTCRSPMRPLIGAVMWRVHQVQFRVVDRGLVGADRAFQLVHGGLLRIHLLLRHCARIIQQSS